MSETGDCEEDGDERRENATQDGGDREWAWSPRVAASATPFGRQSPPDARRRGGSHSSTPRASARRSPPSATSTRWRPASASTRSAAHGSLHPVHHRRRDRGDDRQRAGEREDRPRPYRGSASARPSAARWCWRTATWRCPTTAGSGWWDPDYAPPFLYQGLVPSSLASEVALKFGAHGPSVVVSTGCTSGIDAIGYGHQMIQDDEAALRDGGRSGSGHLPDLDGVLRPDQGDLAAQRRRRARLAPVRPRPRWVRDGRGRRRC